MSTCDNCGVEIDEGMFCNACALSVMRLGVAKNILSGLRSTGRCSARRLNCQYRRCQKIQESRLFKRRRGRGFRLD